MWFQIVGCLKGFLYALFGIGGVGRRGVKRLMRNGVYGESRKRSSVELVSKLVY